MLTILPSGIGYFLLFGAIGLLGFRNLMYYALYNSAMTFRRMLDSFILIFLAAAACSAIMLGI